MDPIRGNRKVDNNQQLTILEYRINQPPVRIGLGLGCDCDCDWGWAGTGAELSNIDLDFECHVIRHDCKILSCFMEFF